MHLVVAVKHDVELPAVLPAMLTPKQEAQNFNASFSAAPNDMAPQANTRLNGHPEEERPHSPPKSPDDHVCIPIYASTSASDECFCPPGLSRKTILSKKEYAFH